MLVKEAISFERGKDPKTAMDIGKNSQYAREKKFEELQTKVNFYIGTGEQDVEMRKELFLGKIYEIEKMIEKLDDVGIKIKSINSSFGSIRFYLGGLISILDSNRVLFYCVTESDAKFILDILRKFSLREYDNFTLTKDGETNIGLNNIDDFDDLIENRITFEKFIGEAQKYPVKKHNDSEGKRY